MSDNVKEEGSVVGNIKGFSAPFGSVPGKKKKKKKNPSKPYGEPELFENTVALAALEDTTIEEVVRKRGDAWVLHDDDTDAEVGVFQDREVAWERQRRIRTQKARTKGTKHKEKEHQLQALTPTLAPKSAKAPAPVQAGKPKAAKKKSPQTQAIKAKKPRRHSGSKRYKAEDIKRAIGKMILEHKSKKLNERSMVSYVFENTPASDESALWEKFVRHLSKETVMADSKLKGILKKMAKTEAKMLGHAVNAITTGLKQSGDFDVTSKGSSQDSETGDVKVDIIVNLKDSDLKLPFGVRLENGRPLVMWPEEARNAINEVNNDETKLLRAELMHVQETILDKMDEVVNMSLKRDSYLKGLEEKVDKLLTNMGPLEVAMLKHVVKNKYKGMR